MKLHKRLESHQLRAAKFLCSRERSLLSYATGTGKSYCLIASAIFLLKKNENVDKVLFIATPNAMIEIEGDFKEMTDMKPTPVCNREELLSFLKSEEKIGIAKYSVLDRDSDEEVAVLLHKNRVSLMFDEAHKMKNPETKASKRGGFLIRYSPQVVFATATAITSKLDDLYQVVDLLIPGYLGDYSDFSSKYMVRTLKTIYIKGGRKKRVWDNVRYKNLHLLRKKLENVTVDFYPDYKIHHQTIETELSSEDEYEQAALGVLEVKRRGRKKSDDQKETDGKPKSYSARMTDAQYVVNNDPAKIKAFLELVLREYEGGCLVYATHHDTIQLLSETLEENNIEYDTITGKTTQKNRKRNKEWFTSDPTRKVLLITTGGGQSLNLQKTNKIIFYDIPFAIGQYVQVLGRVVRYFSSFSEFYAYFVVVKDTIDEYKTHYVVHNAEPLRKVMKNEVGSGFGLSSEFNDYVLRKLKNRFLWKRKKKT